MTTLAGTLQGFFTERLIGQRHASEHTISSYRDTFRLLLNFAHHHTGRPPAQLELGDLDAELIGRFLDHLETVRSNSVRTRNNRLAAIHSMFNYAAFRHPEHAADIQRVLAIPPKRHDRQLVSFLPEHTYALAQHRLDSRAHDLEARPAGRSSRLIGPHRARPLHESALGRRAERGVDSHRRAGSASSEPLPSRAGNDQARAVV